MSGTLTGSSPIKGWLMGLLGLFVAGIGQDPVHAHERFTFGWNELSGGIALIPALVGGLLLSASLSSSAAGLTREQVNMDRETFLSMMRWDEPTGMWVLKSGFEPPAGIKTRAEVMQITDIFRAKIVDVQPKSLTIEITGNDSKVEKFLTLMESFGVQEITRTGKAAMPRK